MNPNLNGWRTGVCGQHYHVQRLKTPAGDWLDLRSYDGQFFALNDSNSMLVVTQHKKVIAGLVSLRDIIGEGSKPTSARLISGIEYCISACDGRRVVTEDFIHQFKRSVVLRQLYDGEPWQLTPAQGKLFTLRPLNDILQVTSFGKVSGLQFCC